MKKPFFYGWWVAIFCIVISFWAGGVFFGITAFIKPIADEFHWTYLAISLAASMRTVEMGLFSPVAGFLADRFGPRKLVFFSGVIGGLSLFMLSRVASLLDFYIAFVVFSIGFSGTGQAVTTTAVANWFRKRIGLATGLAVVGYGAGGIWLPFIAWLITGYGWRSSLTILCIITWIIVLPASLLLRHRPEQYGCLPDGDSQPAGETAAAATGKVSLQEREFTTRDALRTRIFWVLALVFLIQFTIVQAVTLHIMPFCASIGIPESLAALIAMSIPLSSVTGRLGGGWLGDRFGQGRVLAVCFFSYTIGLVFLYFGRSLWQVLLFLAFFGPAFGGMVVMRAVIVRQYFGRKAFGSIQGLIIAAMTLGGVAGPSFAGWVYDVSGGYHLAWLVFALTSLVAAVIVLTYRKALEQR